MRLLDLFCGAGGAGMGYRRAGFEVVGVDVSPQPNYPFEFIQADAMTVSFAGYDVVHASPPCQRFSALQKQNKREYPDYLTPIREKLIESGLPYVIENVVGAPLIDPIRLCGSSFGKHLQRHRLFESNVPLVGKPCAHASIPKTIDVYEHGRWFKSRFARVYGHGWGKGSGDWKSAMDIDWMTRREIVEAIPPYYTEWIGAQLR